MREREAQRTSNWREVMKYCYELTGVVPHTHTRARSN
eukprot:SAG22_NODE_3761_length_1540_cov_1.131853_1_plen_36_part_10